MRPGEVQEVNARSKGCSALPARLALAPQSPQQPEKPTLRPPSRGHKGNLERNDERDP